VLAEYERGKEVVDMELVSELVTDRPGIARKVGNHVVEEEGIVGAEEEGSLLADVVVVGCGSLEMEDTE